MIATASFAPEASPDPIDTVTDLHNRFFASSAICPRTTSRQ